VAAALSGAPQTWAYGALIWDNETVLSSAYSEAVRTYVGEQAITTMTNVTSNVYEMNEVYTTAETYYVQYCEPNCAAPTLFENFTESYLAVENEWANITRAASVHEGSTVASAYGILNASSSYSENLSESWVGLHGSAVYYQGYYYFDYAAGTSIAFSPALGLIPLTSTTGLTWNSTSAYRADGNWLESYSYNYTEPSAGYNYAFDEPHYTGSDTLAGNETVNGKDLGPVTLAGGASARSIALTYTGAYNLALGYLLTPSGGSIFEGNSGWSVGINPAPVAANDVDVATSSDGSNSPDIIGASTSWTVGPSSPPVNSTGPAPPSGAAAPTNTGTVQTEPEPLPYAESSQRCIAGGCPSGALPAAPSARWNGSIDLLGIGIAAAAALGAGVGLWIRRRGGRSNGPGLP
jgi:hypothetical protein